MNEANTTATEATVTQQPAEGATKKAKATKKATAKKKAPKAKKAAKTQTPAKKQAAKPKAKKDVAKKREGSKSAVVLELMRRAKGATLTEIMAATDWQRSVRGFISGAFGKKIGIKVESTRRDDGERVYRIG